MNSDLNLKAMGDYWLPHGQHNWKVSFWCEGLCCSQKGCFSLLCDVELHSSLGGRKTGLRALVFPPTFLILVISLFLEPFRKSSAKQVQLCFLPVNVLSAATWTQSNPLSGCTLGWSPVCPGDLFLRTGLSLFSEFVILQAPASSHCLF